MTRSYAGAGVAAPVAGSDNSPTFFAGIFNYLMSYDNAMETALYSSLGTLNASVLPYNAGTNPLGRTAAAIASTLAQRDANGDIFFRDTYVRSIVASATLYSGAAVLQLTDATTGKVLNAALPTALTATAAGLTTPQSTETTLSDYRVTPSGGNGTVSVAAGNAYIDSVGTYIPAGTATTVTLPTQPTGTNLQYCWITKPTITGTPHASTNGTVGASPPLPAYPIGEEPLALVLWWGATTRPGGIVQAADIINLRGPLGGGGGVGSTGIYTPATPVVAVGSSGSAFDLNSLLTGGQLANSTPVNGITPANMRIDSRLISATGGSNDAPLSHFLDRAATPNFIGLIVPGSTTGTLTLNLGNGDPAVVVEAYGKRQEAVWNATVGNHVPVSPVFSTVGLCTLMADVSGSTYFTLAIVAGAVTSANNRVPLMTCYFDGATFYTIPPHGPYYPMQPIVNGANFQPLHQSYIYATQSCTVLSTITLIQIGGLNTPAFTFDLPAQGLTAICRWSGKTLAPGTPGTGDARLYLMTSNGVTVPGLSAGGVGYGQATGHAANQVLEITGYQKITNLNSGPVNFALAYYSGYITNLYSIIEPTLDVEITR